MNKKERAAELGKDLLIFLLVLSAIWLASRPQLYGRQISEWFGGFLESPGQAVSGETGTETGSEQAIHPVRMAVMTEQGRYGTPYDEEATQALFSTTANVLNEALNSVGPAERVSRGEWEKSLQLCPGIYFEFAAALPLSALSVLLSSDGETSGLEGRVSRLNLAVDQEGVRLFYINEENGLYYACDTDVVSQSQIETAIDGLTPNGVSFAFERQDCDNLASYTMLPDQTPLPAVYLSANPLTAETEEILLEQLGFRTQGTSYYEAPDGTVYLNSGDTLRVGEGGQILFTANPAGEARFTIGGGGEKTTSSEVMETVSALVRQAMGLWQGEAELQLTLYEEQADGSILMEFSYYLNGARVTQYNGNSAARVVVRDGVITDFELWLRSYSLGSEATALLPVAQAAAAVTALGEDGGELLLCYYDLGGDTVRAGWAITR